MIAARIAGAACLSLTVMLAGPVSGQDAPTGPACPSGSIYCAGEMADRVILVAGADPAHEANVSWRTRAQGQHGEIEIVRAVDSPDLEHRAQRLSATSTVLETPNGRALYHHAHLADLKPDTVYAYRVRGAADWSEWFQFRTGAEGFAPFRALFFGDMQRHIRELGARVVRQAFLSVAMPELVLHAGDLVQQRDGGVHDDEWGQWFAAGGANYASVFQVPASGNHEYFEVRDAEGHKGDVLSPHWEKVFALPRNGAPSAPSTTYSIDYQGVRIAVLDGTAGRKVASLEDQARWLKRVLEKPGAVWSVVLIHQPFYPCARPRDPGTLNRILRPVIEGAGVDLVLAGHDHCYARVTGPNAQRRAGEPRRTPVHVVSVAGGKMYPLNGRAPSRSDRFAEDTQLYQAIDFTRDRLSFRTFTATGQLYDAFEITGENGHRIVEEPGLKRIRERRCTQALGPDGAACTAH